MEKVCFHSPQLPTLTDDYAISVACLDLHYSVSVKVSKVKEENLPVALRDLLDEDTQRSKIVYYSYNTLCNNFITKYGSTLHTYQPSCFYHDYPGI